MKTSIQQPRNQREGKFSYKMNGVIFRHNPGHYYCSYAKQANLTLTRKQRKYYKITISKEDFNCFCEGCTVGHPK